MRLTPAEIEETRRVAAEIVRDPGDLSKEGERIKEEGYRGAYTAASQSMERIGGTGLSAYGGGPAPEREGEAEAG